MSITTRTTLAVVACLAATAPAATALAASAGTTGTADISAHSRGVVLDKDGTRHEHFERTYKGMRVVGGDYITHSKAGKTEKTFNRRENVAPGRDKAALSAADATARGRSVAATDVEPRTAELVVFNGAAGAVLAYDVVAAGTRADQTPTRLHSIVDATDGDVLDSWDEIAEGTGTGVMDGKVTFTTTKSGTSYLMKDEIGHSAADMGGKTRGTGTVFTDADDVWGDGTQSDRASAGVDAIFGAQTTFDFYNTQLGRAGIWNTGKGAPSRVHYGRGYANAFWDGTQMTYGDGSNNAEPLTELDVAGHEMSHGVTENTARLTYSGESGGLNEATSDIFGTAVEWYAGLASDVPDYLIGEKLHLTTTGALRFMDQPSKDGRSPNCYSSTVGSLDVHYSSGPLNHWYYLLSEGSGAKTVNGVAYNSPTCNGAAVTGIGHQAAEKIWYRALSTYLTSSSGYVAGRDAAIRAAKDLSGAGSAQCTATAASFDAIAVPKGSLTC